MGQKLYKNINGGYGFVYHREGFVKIDNYIYDLWLPLIGARAITVYGLYSRLAREGYVKAIPQEKLASALRMGHRKLKEINDKLEECGFIKIRKPEGYEITMHWSSTIEVFDAPKVVPREIIEKYQKPSGYEVLCDWLIQDENNQQNNTEGSGNLSSKGQVTAREGSPERSNIEDLNIEDLNIEDLEKERAKARGILGVSEKQVSDEADRIRKRVEHLKKIRENLDEKMPLDWLAAHIDEISIDPERIKAEKQRENKILDGIEMSKEQYIANIRGWAFPPYTELAIAFFEATGIKAVQERDRKKWLAALDRLYRQGVKPTDIWQGVGRAKEKGLIIKSPFSIEATTIEMKHIREQYERKTFG